MGTSGRLVIFGGVPLSCLYDNPRMLVLGRSDGKVLWHPLFEDFDRYWGFTPKHSKGRRRGRIFTFALEPQEHAFSMAVERYDRPHTFFYFDPPYYGIKGYRVNFERADFEKMAAVLATVKDKFLLSLNDHKEVRRFRAFQIRPVELCYSAAPAKAVHRTYCQELLISNY